MTADKTPEQRRAEAIAEIEESVTRDAQARLAELQLNAAMACVTARLMGLPDPEQSRRIISLLPVEHRDA